MNIEKGLIPVALARAKLVKPCTEVQTAWEKAIYKDLETPSRTFGWNEFLRSLLP